MGVFETNSSSMHSIAVHGADGLVTVEPGEAIVGVFGEFGWGYERYHNWRDRLSYALTYLQYRVHIEDTNDWKEYDRRMRVAYFESDYYRWLQEMVKEGVVICSNVEAIRYDRGARVAHRG